MQSLLKIQQCWSLQRGAISAKLGIESEECVVRHEKNMAVFEIPLL